METLDLVLILSASSSKHLFFLVTDDNLTARAAERRTRFYTESFPMDLVVIGYLTSDNQFRQFIRPPEPSVKPVDRPHGFA
jgi:hypothetical protein